MTRHRRQYQRPGNSGPVVFGLVALLVIGVGTWAFSTGKIRVELGADEKQESAGGGQRAPSAQRVEVQEAPAQPAPPEEVPTPTVVPPEPAQGENPAPKVPTLEEVRVKRAALEVLAVEAVKASATIPFGAEHSERRSAAERAERLAWSARHWLDQCEDELRGGHPRMAALWWIEMLAKEKAARSYLRDLR